MLHREVHIAQLWKELLAGVESEVNLTRTVSCFLLIVVSDVLKGFIISKGIRNTLTNVHIDSNKKSIEYSSLGVWIYLPDQRTISVNEFNMIFLLIQKEHWSSQCFQSLAYLRILGYTIESKIERFSKWYWSQTITK